MASVLNTNMASISAQRYLTSAQNKLQGSYERLSSGSRINRAQDDAAGMGVSQKLTASINATSMSIRNANDAIGVVQTAEGALAEISTMLQRFKELSVQGSNAALSTDQLGFISVEMGNLRDEIVAIADRTKFNGISLLANPTTGGPVALKFQTGPELDSSADETHFVAVQTLNLKDTTAASDAGLGSLYTLLGEDNSAYIADGKGTINTIEGFNELQGTIDLAITEVATQRAKFGAQVTRLNHNIANLTALHENLSSANSRVVDTDYANETANLTKTQILQQAATAMLSQANAQPNVVLALLK
jgi:flagellin